MSVTFKCLTATIRGAALAAAVFATLPVAQATTITQWNFNIATGVNNSPAPSVGVGSATPVGMNNNANNADILAAGGANTDSGAPNNAWRVRGSVNNGWSGTTELLSGAQFSASTSGYQDVVVSFDLSPTDGSPRHGQFQYSTDGTTFTSFGPLLDFNAHHGTPAVPWINYSFDLSSVAGVNDNPSFAFKLVSAFSPDAFTNNNGPQAAGTAFQRADAGNGVYNGTAGNWRFDMVTIAGSLIPEPSSASLIGGALAGLALTRSRRRC